MVRAHIKQTPEEKKESHKKKAPSKKKAETGTWPCKMSGCNKVFAREADLKRHQRTTKLHSQPGFACPQCDATFTRTDALRRHQKSRHNGIVIEPDSRATDGDGASSASISPSGTPPRSQGEPSSSKSTPPTALAHPGTAGPASGPSSYYRQHTMTAYPSQRPPPGMMVDPHYAPAIGLPTSATRLHQANWHPPPPPPWVNTEGHPLPPGHVYHMPPGYYPASTYYRHPSGMMPIHHPIHSQFSPHAQNGISMPPHSQRGSPTGSASDPNHANSDAEMEDGSSQASDAAPAIDPALEGGPETATSQPLPGPSSSGESTAEDSAMTSLKIAQAAVQAVLNYEKDQAHRVAESRRASGSPNEKTNGEQTSQLEQVLQGLAASPAPQSGSGRLPSTEGGDADADGEADADGDNASSRAMKSPTADGAHLQAAEQMMTEDGEPMLNPAELLTQESLASPPAS
ncbi:hypothetical protein B0H21DRAFT_735054 [Amylocystis lapponica]|nr:hypothetical protein B0H21DRAFT_735054 [Amylocystis lapponica]